MAAQIIDGKALAAELRAQAKERAAALARKGVVPGLAVILVGEDPASVSYVTGKGKACVEAGMKSFERRLPENTPQEELLSLIEGFNRNPEVHGILVQIPLPTQIDESAVIAAISPEKDVDGFTPVNIGRMILGERCFLPCTPHGIIKLVQRANVPTQGAHVVIVGRSNLVGRPLANLFLRKELNATVTVCHTGTRDLAEHTRRADILVACAGKPRMITGDMVKPGACVIDVGVTRVEDAAKAKGFRLVGDVDFEAACRVAGSITPVPGGVGPMTIAMLMINTVESAERTA
jgi:methylenetetrahydrofolate dehydrogenase (NADP+)/methenyltetrahydrofolate cyclohydrolase